MNRSLRRQRLKEPKERQSVRTPRAVTRATAGSAGTAKGAAGRGGFLNWRPRFAMDVINELRKVVWPTRDDVIYLTIVVVLVTLILGAVLGAIDIGFGWLIEKTLLS
jgi:preprotein translocase subunit SecE